MNLTMILIIGGGFTLLLLVVGVVVTARSERSIVEERLGRYMEDESQVAKEDLGERPTPVGDWLNRQVVKSSWGEGIARQLARADLKLKPAEYIALTVISVVASGFILGFINQPKHPLSFFTIIGGIIGIFLPRIYVGRQQSKRLNRFNNQLADMLNMTVNGLRAGFSTTQAMEAVSKEMPPPICDEFRRVVQEMQLGLPMEQALDNLLRRIPSDDLDLLITAINVQREVGGNLAEILDTISYTIRERVRIKGEIRVLTSQVIYSGRFLSSMPVILLVVLYFLNRDYMMQFFSEPRIVGYISLAIATLLIISGYFVMTRIANIEV